MKLKHIVCIITLIILALMLWGTEVEAKQNSGTNFYDKGYHGSSNGFWSDWNTSENAFCLNAGADAPTSMNMKLTVSPPYNNYASQAFEYENGTHVKSQDMNKFLYIFSQVTNYGRHNNVENKEQHAIWKILGQAEEYLNHTCNGCDTSKMCQKKKDYYTSNINEINQILANATAYDTYVKNYQTPSISTTEVIYNDSANTLTGFKIEHTKATETIGSKTGTYGNITLVELCNSSGTWVRHEFTSTEIASNGTRKTTKVDLTGVTEQYTKIRVTFESECTSASYIVFAYGKIGTGNNVFKQQSFMFGEAWLGTEKIEASIDLNPIEIYVNKLDSTSPHNRLSGAEFDYAIYKRIDTNYFSSINYDVYSEVDGTEATIKTSGWKSFTTNSSNSTKITFSKIDSSLNEVWVILREMVPPSGYEKVSYNMAIKFQKDANGKWTPTEDWNASWDDTVGRFKRVNKQSAITYSGGKYTISSGSMDRLYISGNTLNVLNKKNNTGLTFYIKKVDEGGVDLQGAGIKVTVGGTTLANYTTDGTAKEISYTPPADSTEVKITVTETATPSGYSNSFSSVTLNFKKENGTWKYVGNSSGTDWNFDGSTLKVINKKGGGSSSLTLTIKKTNETGTPLSDAKFTATIDNGTLDYNSFTIGSKTITIKPIDQSKPIILSLIETDAPTDYSIISKNIKIKFTKSGSTWVSEIIAGSEAAELSRDTRTLTIKNKKEPTTTDTTIKDIINGWVYLDGYEGSKVASGPSGKRENSNGTNKPGIEGVIVRLSGYHNAQTVTDENGYYEFTDVVRNQNYTVTFEYDGVNYRATTPGVGSQARENSSTRNTFNGKFTTISYGKSNGVANLEYFPYGSNSNWNPSYYGRDPWLLKTLMPDQTVKSNDFKMTASTNFRLENWYQKYYNSDGSNCQNCPGHTSTSTDAEGNETSTTTYDHCSCSWNGTWTKGNQWVNHPENGGTELVNGTDPTGTGTCASNATRYRHQATNYFICGGTTEVTTVSQTESLINKNYYKTDRNSMTPTVTSKNTRDQSVIYNLNFGLVKREVDLSLINDLYTANVSINEKSTTYEFYDIPIADDTIHLGNVNSNNVKNYKLELTQKDFLYGNSIYPTGNSYIRNTLDTYIKNSGYTENKKLNIIATYRITLNNQSNSAATVKTLDYYYDANYTLSRVYASNGNNISYTSKGTQTIDGITYNKITIEKDISLGNGGKQCIYVEFIVNYKNNNTIDGTNKNTIEAKTYNTIAEITSYYTSDGKVDIDSAPGNAVQNNKLVYEDDTDMAPGLRLGVNNNARILSGTVWEDDRNVSEVIASGQTYDHGDGIKGNNESGISGIIAQLIEVRGNTYYIWDQVKTNSSGVYTFNNFIPGNYIVRFIYGYDSETKEFNGQDYKSTTSPKIGTSEETYYNLHKSGAWYNPQHIDASKKTIAFDNEARRLNTMSNTVEINKELGEKLKNKTEYANTYMYADSLKINIPVVFDSSNQAKSTANTTTVEGNKSSYYNFTNVNFGLEERPKTAIELERHVNALRITANDGSTIIDAEAKYSTSGFTVTFTENSIRKALTGWGADIRDKGYWHLETDIEETMQGASLELEYKYIIRNVGEIDYTSVILAQDFENKTVAEYKTLLNQKASEIRNIINTKGYNNELGKYLGSTYYTGKIGEDVRVVKTHVGKIEDYINNDLKFVPVTSSDFITNGTNKTYSIIKENGTSGNTQITTTVISRYDVGKISPLDSAKNQNIILESNGKLTSTGVLQFPGNIAQIKTAYSNAVGRRDVYSIPGNLKFIQNNDINNTYLRNNANASRDCELDEYWVEPVEITKPTGENKQLIIALSISITAGLAVVASGIVVIKKYVL